MYMPENETELKDMLAAAWNEGYSWALQDEEPEDNPYDPKRNY